MEKLVMKKSMETVTDFAKRTHSCRHTIYRQIQAGTLPHLRLGRKILINVREALTAMREKSAS